MPLPAGPPLVRPSVAARAFRAARDHPDPARRPLRFPVLEYVFEGKDLRKQHGLACRICLRFRQCMYGPQQQFRCFAYWLWSEASTDPDRVTKLEWLKKVPLTEEALTPLTPEELLGIFYIRRYNFGTVIDFSPYGLRQRLLMISQENSRYLLTTE